LSSFAVTVRQTQFDKDIYVRNNSDYESTEPRFHSGFQALSSANITYAMDPIPEGTIALGEANDILAKRLACVKDRLFLLRVAGIEDWFKAFQARQGRGLDEIAESDGDSFPVYDAANGLMRQGLAGGEIVAFVRDPVNGEWLALPRSGWETKLIEYRVSDSEGVLLLTMFHPLEDWVDPTDLDSPGPPGSTIHGANRRVFLKKREFESWVAKLVGRSGLGRPKHSGSWDIADRPLLDKMNAAIKAGLAKSATDAARQFASEAQGGGSFESKVRRLQRRYEQRYS
jgi:hypothetical protein